MRPLERVANLLQDLAQERYLRLLSQFACVAWIQVAQAQSEGRSAADLPSLQLRPAQSLAPIRTVTRASKSLGAPEVSGLRLAQQLSPQADQSLSAGTRPAGASPPPQTAENVAGPEQPVSFEAVRPGPSTPVSRTATPVAENLPDLTSVGWVIPPIRWGGNTASSYNFNSSPGGTSTFSETQTLNLRASSYIYQPWYAQVSGDVGLLSGSSKQSGGDSASSSGSRNMSMTYGGNLNLFPQSRFPFQAYVQSSDSRASADAQGQHYTSTRLGARQSYRPEVGPDNYSAAADRSIVTTSTVRSVVDALQGTYATTIADHVLNSNARYSRNLGDVGGQGSNLLSLTATHSWRADEEFTVASSASYSNNQIRMLTGTGLSLNNSQVMQAASSVTWLPDEDLPLIIIGGGNFLRMNTLTETAKADLTTLNGYANANYRFSQNLSATAGVTLAQSLSSGTSQLSSGQNASISYSGNPLILGDYSYNWGTGGGISNQMISGGVANRNLSGQIQHSLLRSIVLSKENAITLNAGQSYSLTHNSTSGQSGILTHTGGASWRLGLGERTLGSLSATLSDSLSTGSFPTHFRSFSAQGNLQTQLSGRSALTASLNVVVSQQLATAPATETSPVLPSTNSGSSTVNGSGQVSYTHRSPFDIANLFYTATFQANASQTNLRLISGDPNALAWQTGNVFQQNIDYRLGRLSFRATGSLATLNGKENASMFFMVSREIGDF